jgi:hypothetical protein
MSVRNQKFVDSPVEGNGFERSVPRQIGNGLLGSSELGPIYRRTGHRVGGAAVCGRHSPPGSGGITTSALSAVQAHHGTEGSNPFPSSGASGEICSSGL